jgi:[lysine-biosynthesis-protein LysW]--L-2-aminoadipate ligase
MPVLSMVYDFVRPEEKFLISAAQKLGVVLKHYDAKDLGFDLQSGLPRDFGELVLQRCASYFRNIHLTAVLEARGLKVVNSLFSALYSGNKLFSSLIFLKEGVPTPRTWVTFNLDSAMEAFQKVGFPAILKPTMGSWGRLVACVGDSDSALSVLEDREQMFPIYQVYYIQEKVQRPPRDIRAIVVGDETVAAIYRISTSGDWRTNTARGGKSENLPVTPELNEICLKASRPFGKGVYGVDLMESSKDGLLVHEVNNTTEFKNVYARSKVDIPSLIIQFLVSLAKK